jgi:hypothetical protein
MTNTLDTTEANISSTPRPHKLSMTLKDFENKTGINTGSVYKDILARRISTRTWLQMQNDTGELQRALEDA